MNILPGIMIPFLGTALGASFVFFLKKEMNEFVRKTLLGFASGVMVAASVWSLLIPAMEMSEHMGKLAFIPAAAGFLGGMLFLLIMDKVIPHLHLDSDCPEGPKCALSKTSMLLFAVTLHNIPEGMAVGVVLAGMQNSDTGITMMSALALSIGIAIQNIPEGAIISMPLKGTGISRGRAFADGVLSGAVEPVGALLTVWLASYIEPVLPYLLAFAAGAMLYVVVEELIPESAEGDHTNVATLGFAAGFVVMMILDVALG
ncbi:MAG TPA: ZIP family metal transporter [Candidatus Bariatricus faecipullorum]|nr:ZIP family metal transporter [Candidatus Bariatricus faecipullorum]